MTNPLLNGAQPGGRPGPMRPGDVRQIHVRDKQTNEIIKTLTLVRTDREYVHDLCDAYNEGNTLEHMEWAVDHAGNLHLREKAEYLAAQHRMNHAVQEAERNRWIASHRQRAS